MALVNMKDNHCFFFPSMQSCRDLQCTFSPCSQDFLININLSKSLLMNLPVHSQLKPCGWQMENSCFFPLIYLFFSLSVLFRVSLERRERMEIPDCQDSLVLKGPQYVYLFENDKRYTFLKKTIIVYPKNFTLMVSYTLPSSYLHTKSPNY